MDAESVVGLGPSGCADELADSRARLVEAELVQVRLVAHWCDLHSGPTTVIDADASYHHRLRPMRAGATSRPLPGELQLRRLLAEAS